MALAGSEGSGKSGSKTLDAQRWQR